MAVTVQVAVNEAQARCVDAALTGIRYGAPKVISRALNKVAVHVRSRIVKAVAGEIRMTQTALRKGHVRLRKASYRRLEAEIRITGKRMTVGAFRPRQTRRGVTYGFWRGAKRELIERAFIRTVHGRLNVWKRAKAGASLRGRAAGLLRRITRRREAAPAGGETLVGRLPIELQRTASVPEVFAGLPEFAADLLRQEIAVRLDGELDTQVRVLLEQRAAARAKDA